MSKCFECGTRLEFDVAPGEERYCSEDCYNSVPFIKEPVKKKKYKCKDCGSTFLSFKKNISYCSGECRANGISRNRQLIHSRDRFRCSYCGRSSISDGVKLHLDHVIPRSKGGKDTADNLITSCESCNCSKHATLYPDDVVVELIEEIKKRNKEFNINPKLKIRF